MQSTAMRLVLAALTFGIAACESSGGDNMLAIDATSAVDGVVFVDANASRSFEATEDQPASDITVALVLSGTADTVARAQTDAGGAFRFDMIPVGRYDVVIPAVTLGDSMNVVYRDPPGEAVEDIGTGDTTSVILGVADTATVRIGISYPVVSVEEARALPIGRRVLVHAIAESSVGAVGDSSLHVQDAGFAIRATRVAAPTVLPGDSVLLLGRTAMRDGQPVLADASATILVEGAPLDSVVIDARTARTAGGGSLDAYLARVGELMVTDTTRTGGWFIITGVDPSGSVDVAVPIAGVSSAYVPGSVISVVGILVPEPGVVGSWQLRPRATSDVVVVDPAGADSKSSPSRGIGL
jgi:hypothetical protein